MDLTRYAGAVNDGVEGLIMLLRGLETNIRFIRFYAYRGEREQVETNASQARNAIEVIGDVFSRYYRFACCMVDLRRRQMSEMGEVREDD